MFISDNGLTLIKKYESFIAVKYLCPAGKPTIGYGHVIKYGESYTKLTEPEAVILLKQDCAIAERCINRWVAAAINQNQFDALVSFVYNVGCNSFLKSTLFKLLNNNDIIGAAGEFKKWKFANGVELAGLERRRIEEAQLFLKKL
jgi:lysozyme